MYRIAKTNELLIKCGNFWRRLSVVQAVHPNFAISGGNGFPELLNKEEIHEAIKNGIIVETDDSLD